MLKKKLLLKRTNHPLFILKVGYGKARYGPARIGEVHTQRKQNAEAGYQAGLGEARWGVAWQGEVHTQRTQNTKAGKRGQGEVRYGTVS